MPPDPIRPFTSALDTSLAGVLPHQKIVTPAHRLIRQAGFIPAHRLLSTPITKRLTAGITPVADTIAAGMPSVVRVPSVFSVINPRPSVMQAYLSASRLSASTLATRSVLPANRLNLSALATRSVVLPVPRVPSVFLGALRPVWSGAFANLGTTILEGALPANLAPLAADVDLDQLWEVLGAEGIALGSVPRTSLAAALLDAPREQERRAILGRRLPDILDDCEEVASRITTGPLAHSAHHLVGALTTARDGHIASAQALLANILDSILRVLDESERKRRTSHSESPTPEVFKTYPLREAVAMLPVWAAYARYRPEKNDPVPYRFNRHATAHSANSRRQYTKRNTAQAALVVTSALACLNAELIRH